MVKGSVQQVVEQSLMWVLKQQSLPKYVDKELKEENKSIFIAGDLIIDSKWIKK